MKCRRCGFVARGIAGLGKHYRKKHPAAMKSRRKRASPGTRKYSQRRRGQIVRGPRGNELYETLEEPLNVDLLPEVRKVHSYLGRLLGR